MPPTCSCITRPIISRSGRATGSTRRGCDIWRIIITTTPISASAPACGIGFSTPLARGVAAQARKIRTNDYVFPGQKRGRPLSGMSMEMLLRRMKTEGMTVHGFRSSFRDWAGDKTSFAREVAEAALAHAIGDETEAAYRRSDALAKRRKLMDAWAAYCEPKAASNAVRLAR